VKDAVTSALPLETDKDVVKLKDKNNNQIINVYENDNREINQSNREVDKSNTEILTG
jgi:hypothetical protein